MKNEILGIRISASKEYGFFIFVERQDIIKIYSPPTLSSLHRCQIAQLKLVGYGDENER